MRKDRQLLDTTRLTREINTGTRRPVYLFCGQEDFLLEEALASLGEFLLPQGLADTSCSRVSGMDTTLDAVLDMVDTVSLFGQSRLIVVTAAPYFSKGNRLEKDTVKRLLSYQQNENTDSCVVFCAPDTVHSLKLVKELTATGAVYHFDPLKATALLAWLQEQVALREKKASTSVLQLFLNRAGHDLRNLASELDKLTTYLGAQKEIDEDSILAVTVRGAQADIFALIDAVVYGKTSVAMALLKDLLVMGEPPLRVLSMVVRQFRLLGEAKERLATGEQNLAAALSIHPYAAEKLIAQARRIDDARITRAVALLLRCELDIKQGRIEPVLAMETLVVALGINVTSIS
ncbi:MAG: DNA polymerase III subunit delta [Firmicutes bacterium]|nr:DNA polymerase III subunit delta [Bacillota bacterium]